MQARRSRSARRRASCVRKVRKGRPPLAALGHSWPLSGRSWAALGQLLAALGPLLGRSWPLLGHHEGGLGGSFFFLLASQKGQARPRRPLASSSCRKVTFLNFLRESRAKSSFLASRANPRAVSKRRSKKALSWTPPGREVGRQRASPGSAVHRCSGAPPRDYDIVSPINFVFMVLLLIFCRDVTII